MPSSRFPVETFAASDLVIAKGQGNYESLSERTDRADVFIAKVKCNVIAEDIGFPTGSNVVEISRPLTPKRTTLVSENISITHETNDQQPMINNQTEVCHA